MLEERRMRFVDEPMGRLFEKMMSTVYLEHPYRQPIIGYKRDLERLTASMTIDFLREYYVPQNVVVAVVGDIDPKKDLKILEKYFGRLSAGPDPKRTDIVEPEQEGQREFVLEADAEPYAAVAYRKPNYPHKDDAPLTIMGEIFAGSSISPLHRELVQKQQVATGIGYSEGPGSAYPNLFFFYLSPKKPNGTKEALAAYERELSKFKSKRVTEVQLKVAKRAIAMSYLKRFKSNMSLAKALTSAHLLYGDWKAMTKWYEEMLAVTAEDVQRVANKYLVPSYRTVGRIEKKVKDVS